MADKAAVLANILSLVKQADHALWTVVDMLDKYQVAYPESEYLASLWSACAELEKSRNVPADNTEKEPA
jgi:hypothetical protein